MDLITAIKENRPLDEIRKLIDDGAIGDIIRFSASFQRYGLHPVFDNFRIKRIGHFSFNESRRNGVATNIARAKFQGHRFGKADNARFGCRVVGLSCVAFYAYNRTHIDNRAAFLFHKNL